MRTKNVSILQPMPGWAIGMIFAGVAIILMLLAIWVGRQFFTPSPEIVTLIITTTPRPPTRTPSDTPTPTATATATLTRTATHTKTPTNPPPTRALIPTRTLVGGRQIPTLYPTLTPSSTATPRPSVKATLLPIHAIDVAYSAELDRLVYLSENPYAVNLWNPVNGSLDQILLDAVPLAISVSGTQAAIGHDKKVTLVDLATQKVIGLFNIIDRANKLQLSPLGWIYTKISAINIQANTVTMYEAYRFAGSSNHNDTKMNIALHPNLQAIYASIEPDSRSYVAFLNADGSPVPYGLKDFGESARCGQLWLSASGERAYTGCGGVYLTSSPSIEFAQFRNSAPFRLYDLVDLPEQQVIVGVGLLNAYDKERQAHLVVYDSESYGLIREDWFPDVQVMGGAYPVTPKKIFLSADGQTLYCIVSVDSQAGLLNNIAVIAWPIHEVVRPMPKSQTP